MTYALREDSDKTAYSQSLVSRLYESYVYGFMCISQSLQPSHRIPALYTKENEEEEDEEKKKKKEKQKRTRSQMRRRRSKGRWPTALTVAYNRQPETFFSQIDE